MFDEYFGHSIAVKYSIIEYNHIKYKQLLHASVKRCICSNPERWEDLNLQTVLFVDESCPEYDNISKDEIIRTAGLSYVFEQITQSHLMVSSLRIDERDLFIYGGSEV